MIRKNVDVIAIAVLLCGIALYSGLKGWIGGALTFGLFALFRSIYGGFGCATPSATQAYLASKTRRAGASNHRVTTTSRSDFSSTLVTFFVEASSSCLLASI